MLNGLPAVDDRSLRHTQDWTRPANILSRLRKSWDRGDILRAALGEVLFPIEFPLKRPTTEQWSTHFSEAREWIRELAAHSTAQLGNGYEVLTERVKHRLLGENDIPTRIRYATLDDALSHLNVHAEIEQWRRAVLETEALFPQLRAWMLLHPFDVLGQGDAWWQILRVLEWFQHNPHSGKYLRQLDIPGIDTKFIEVRKGLFSTLLDLVLAPAMIDHSLSGSRNFERRYGLRAKPQLVRFRILDPHCVIGGFADVSIPIEDLARVPVDVDSVFITENDMNGLAFPSRPRSMVIFGSGYGVESLAALPWLCLKRICYWGDIDTHGFAILDNLRRHFPHVSSFLMDQTTFVRHRRLWSDEARQYRGNLDRLTSAESMLYHDLSEQTFGTNVRLEQERIEFRLVEQALEALGDLY